MNKDIILDMVNPHIEDSSLTYDEFDEIFVMLNKKEKYEVSNILYENGIDLVDKKLLKENKENNKNIIVNIDKTKDKHIVIKKNHEIKQSNENLCFLIKEGNKQAEQDLCIKNERLVYKYASSILKHSDAELDINDIMQAGFLGLIKGAKKFDISMGYKFSTYVTWWIKQSMIREIYNTGYNIRIPVHVFERINKINNLENKYIAEGIYFEERVKRIADNLDLSEEQVINSMIIKNNYLKIAHLDTPVGKNEDIPLGELLEDNINPTLEEIILHKILKEEVIRSLDSLNERERTIIIKRFGIINNIPMTLEQIGEEFGVTRERIRQIEAKALNKIKKSGKFKSLREFYEGDAHD